MQVDLRLTVIEEVGNKEIKDFDSTNLLESYIFNDLIEHMERYHFKRFDPDKTDNRHFSVLVSLAERVK